MIGHRSTRGAIAASLLAAAIALACLFMPGSAKANIVCSLTSQSIAFGTSDTATGTIGYSCTSYNLLTTNFTICSTLGSPSYPGTAAQPQMLNGASTLNFNLYTDSARTTIWRGTTVLTKSVTVPAFSTVTGSMSFYGLIPTGQLSPAGSYTAYFYSTSLGMMNFGSCQEYVLLTFDGTNNTLTATATVANACTVSAGTALALGTVASTATNTWSSTNISVTCPNGTAYYIGLAPSNGSSTGAGALTGTGGNTDQPAYQLRSGSSSGPVWGNTATATSVGNGVSGTGTGSAQSKTVYATLPSANYRPDTYQDTVTVNVNY